MRRPQARQPGAGGALRQPARGAQGGGGGEQDGGVASAAASRRRRGRVRRVPASLERRTGSDRHVDHPRLDQQPGLRHHDDGGAVRAGPVLVQQAARRADARHHVPGVCHRGAVPGRIARGGGERGQRPVEEARQQRRRRQADPVAQPRGAQRDEHRVRPRRQHGPRDAGRARPRRARCSRASRATSKAPTLARWNNDNAQPVVNCWSLLSQDAQRRASCRSSATSRSASGCSASPAWRAWRSAAWCCARCASTSIRRGCAPTASRRPRSPPLCATPTSTSRWA